MTFTYQASRPYLTGNESAYVAEAIETGMISARGPYMQRFEQEFADFTGKAHGVACSSGTAALTLAMRALGIGPGDEVIVPEFTMIATAWAVTYVGATPVFVDCADDLTIDVDLLERKITPRTKAVVPVHVHGRRCDMVAITRLAREYNLWVVEDSAEAHGIAPSGDIACFSLYANKIITAGEGGVCVTDDARLAERMVHLRGMAIGGDHSFLHDTLAYNFRMTSLQAGFALAQLEKIDEILAMRGTIEKRYDAGLQDIAGLTLMPPREVLWMYDVRAERRDELCEFLAGEGIETRAASRPFDAARDGFVAAEGAAVLVLERVADATARGGRVHAVVRGYGAATDAHHATAPDPEGRGVERALRTALADAGLGPSAVDHVNAHGTSTPLGDVIEARALRRVLGDRPVVTSTKGVTGHSLAASGAMEAAYTALTLARRSVPPTANLTELDPRVELDVVTGAPRSAQIDVGVSTSLGFGGHNAALVLTAG